MAITDPQAIAFVNTYVRPLADQLARVHTAAKMATFLYQAKNYSSLISNDTTSVNDGSPDDGRTAITGADVNAIVGIALGLVTSNEANDNAVILQIGKVAVNPGN